MYGINVNKILLHKDNELDSVFSRGKIIKQIKCQGGMKIIYATFMKELYTEL